MAEFAFDIVSPEYPPPRPLTQRNDLMCLRQPVDFREGLGMAYDDLRLVSGKWREGGVCIGIGIRDYVVVRKKSRFE